MKCNTKDVVPIRIWDLKIVQGAIESNNIRKKLAVLHQNSIHVDYMRNEDLRHVAKEMLLSNPK